MKKSKSMRIASLLLVLVLVTTCFVGTTFAKYTSSATGSDSATVAKWSVKVNDTEIAVSPAATVNFDLFSTTTFKDSDGTSAESDVKNLYTDKLVIAPGTSGSFNLFVKNESEVNLTYDVTFTQTQSNVPEGKPIPIKFYKTYDEQTKTFSNEITVASDGTTYTLVDDEGLGYQNVTGITTTVYWQWAYSTGEDGDATDTALGIEAQDTTAVPSVEVTATITATQVD